MTDDLRASLRERLLGYLTNQGDSAGFTDNEALFTSGRIDSFSLMQLVLHLESDHGVDFSNVNFEPALLDSVDRIVDLVTKR